MSVLGIGYKEVIKMSDTIDPKVQEGVKKEVVTPVAEATTEVKAEEEKKA